MVLKDRSEASGVSKTPMALLRQLESQDILRNSRKRMRDFMADAQQKEFVKELMKVERV